MTHVGVNEKVFFSFVFVMNKNATLCSDYFSVIKFLLQKTC